MYNPCQFARAKKTNNMGKFIESLGGVAQNTIGGLVGTGLSRLFGLSWSPEKAMKKQWEYNQKVMALQNQYNQQAAAQGQEYAKEYWDYTNAENQANHLKNAGLNIGLMYGQSGAGGMGASGGSRQEGVDQAQGNPVGMALQTQQIEQQERMNNAQIKLAEAQAQKTEEEAKKISGVDIQEALARIEKIYEEAKKINKEGNWYEATAKTAEAQEEYTRQLKKVAEGDEALRDAQIATEWEKVALMLKEGLEINENIENKKISNRIARSTEEATIQEAYLQCGYLMAAIAREQSQKEVNEKEVYHLQAMIEELAERADKEKWDKETYRMQIEGMIDRWEAQTFNERLGLGVEVGDKLLKVLLARTPRTSKTTTYSTRKGGTIRTDSQTTTSGW